MDKDNLALRFACCKKAMSFCRLCHWQRAGNKWGNRFLCNELQYLVLVFGGSCELTAANYHNSLESPCLGINRCLLAAEVADQNNSCIERASFEACLQRRTYQLYHKVDASCLLQSFGNILLAMVDNEVRT